MIERIDNPPALTAGALDARLADGGAFPIVEPGRCTFAHHGPAIEVRLVHFGVGFPADLRYDPVDDSDWWVLTLTVPDGSRVEYKVEVEMKWAVGGTTRSKKFTTLLLREVPFGERLRARIIEGKKPEKKE